MTIIQATAKTKRVIDLSGPEGNAFSLIGNAAHMYRQMGRDPVPLIKEMQSGNYDNLIQVFDREFGHCIDLIIPRNDFDEDHEELNIQMKVTPSPVP